MAVKLKVYYCRERLKDSFDTKEIFLRCTIFKSEHKVVYNISSVVSVSRRNIFFELFNNPDKT